MRIRRPECPGGGGGSSISTPGLFLCSFQVIRYAQLIILHVQICLLSVIANWLHYCILYTDYNLLIRYHRQIGHTETVCFSSMNLLFIRV